MDFCSVSLLQGPGPIGSGSGSGSTLTLFACTTCAANQFLAAATTQAEPQPAAARRPQPTFIAVRLGGNCNKWKRIPVLEFELQLKLVSLHCRVTAEWGGAGRGVALALAVAKRSGPKQDDAFLGCLAVACSSSSPSSFERSLRSKFSGLCLCLCPPPPTALHVVDYCCRR